jgi:methionyl-tRNA formyltransferase
LYASQPPPEIRSILRLMKVVFFGTPDFAVPTLRRLLCSPHEVALVVSRPDSPAGRKQVMTSPPVVEAAREAETAVDQPKSLKGSVFAEALAEIEADVAVVVAYGRLIPANLLDIPRHGFVNLHPSLLPRHRGPSPIQWTLVCGDSSAGVTTMQLDEGMDTGPILLQRRVAVEAGETADRLSLRLAVEGAELILETLAGLEEGSITPSPQPDQGATVTPMLRRGFGKVDWSLTARRLVNRLRGLTPWPGLYSKLRGGRVKIHGLEEVNPSPRGQEEPGTILGVGPQGILVRCGRGSSVLVTELQREGRRRLPADAFLVGEQVLPGERFG